MHMYTYSAANLTGDMNIGKDTLAETLFSSGVINKEQYRVIKEDFAVIVAEKNFFGKALGKVLGWDNKDALYFKCVQINNIKYKNKENDLHQSTNGDKERLD